MNNKRPEQKIQRKSNTVVRATTNNSDGLKKIGKALTSSSLSRETNIRCSRFLNHHLSHQKQLRTVRSVAIPKKKKRLGLNYNECYCNIAVKKRGNKVANDDELKLKVNSTPGDTNDTKTKCDDNNIFGRYNSFPDNVSDPSLLFDAIQRQVRDFSEEKENEENHYHSSLNRRNRCYNSPTFRERYSFKKDYEHARHPNSYACSNYNRNEKCSCNSQSKRSSSFTSSYELWVQELANFRRTHWLDCHYRGKK